MNRWNETATSTHETILDHQSQLKRRFLNQIWRASLIVTQDSKKMDKSSNQVNGNVNPNQQQSSSSNSNRNQNHNHNQNYQFHPHPPNYSYNQQNSANSAWNLHPSFGAAFNHPSTSAPGHQSYNSYAGSYRPPSSNLSWNRGQEARGAVGGSIDKGKGKGEWNFLRWLSLACSFLFSSPS